MTHHRISVDDYENGRPQFGRSVHEMAIPSSTRTDILLGSGGYYRHDGVGSDLVDGGEGFDEGEGCTSLWTIQEAIREVNVTKRHRRRTVQTLQTAWIEETYERARRAVLGRTVRIAERRRGREIVERGLRCDRLVAADAAAAAADADAAAAAADADAADAAAAQMDQESNHSE